MAIAVPDWSSRSPIPVIVLIEERRKIGRTFARLLDKCNQAIEKGFRETMPEEINYDRRRCLSVAGRSIAAAEVVDLDRF